MSSLISNSTLVSQVANRSINNDRQAGEGVWPGYQLSVSGYPLAMPAVPKHWPSSPEAKSLSNDSRQGSKIGLSLFFAFSSLPVVLIPKPIASHWKCKSSESKSHKYTFLFLRAGSFYSIFWGVSDYYKFGNLMSVSGSRTVFGGLTQNKLHCLFSL